MTRRPGPFSDLLLLPREVWVLCLSALVNRAGTMVLPFLVLYLTRDLGFSAERAGGVLALFGLVSVGGAPLGGWLADRFGSLPVMKVSLLLSACFLFAYPAGRSPASVLLLTAAWAGATELFRPANMAALSLLAPPAQRRQAFALFRLSINLGMSVGPALGGFLATRSFGFLFVVDGATTLAAFAVLALMAKGGPRPEPTVGAHPLAGIREALGDSRLLAFAFATLPVGIVFFQHLSAMPLFLVRDLGLSASTYGLAFTVNTLLVVLLEVPVNSVMARWPYGRSLFLGALLTAVGFGALGLARSLPTVLATVVVWTFGEMITFPAMSAYVSEIAPEASRGAYMGFYTMSFNVAFAVGPWAGTAVLERFGGRVLWACVFLVGLSAALLLSRVRTDRSEVRGA